MNIEEIRNEILQDLELLETENRKWLNTNELADYVTMSVEQLELWRRENYGPSYLKLGKRKVIYPKIAIADFIVANPIKTM